MRGLSICALILVWFAGAGAAEMDWSLQSQLDSSGSADTIQALAYFTTQADIASLDQELKIEHATLAERNRRVILALQAATAGQPEMASFLDTLKSNGQIKDYKMFWIANMFWVEGTKEGIETVALRQELSKVYLNYKIESIDPVQAEPASTVVAGHENGLSAINAPAAWAHGWTGAGRVVMNIDTGVDGTHPALAARFRGDVNQDGNVSESWFDPYTTHYPMPVDSDIHGTHTMGIICGRTPSGDTIGVAIDAKWIAAAAIDRGGNISQTIADAISSFQWAIDPDGNPNTQDNPDAIGNSWGVTSAHGYQPCDETLWLVIDNCEAAGSAVIFSAGNEGASGPGTIRRPADRGTTPYNCFSVGAVDGNNPSYPVADFSSRGPSYCGPNGEEVIKPEVVAPGVNVRSSVPGGGYQLLSGTSMASPHITGAIAVLRQVNPNLDVDVIKQILIETAHEAPADSIPGEDNNYGKGIIDLYEACLIAQSFSLIEGTVVDAANGPIRNARISIVGTTRNTFTNYEGQYSMAVQGGLTYPMHISCFGYISIDTLAVVSVNDTLTMQLVMHPTPSGILSGVVRDKTALTPIAGAILEVLGTPIQPETTDAAGRYRFPAIPGGEIYAIFAHGPGHEPAQDSVFIPQNDSTVHDFSVAAFESFESSDAGWIGTGSWEWGIPVGGPGTAFDGSKVWMTSINGFYPNNANDSLFTGYITVESASATMSFYQWYDFEPNWDGGNVAVTIDGGASWTLITPVGNYSNGNIVSLFQPGYTGSSGGWKRAVFNLGAYNGMAIIIRFRIATDNSIQRAGWYLDAFSLNGATAREMGSPMIAETPGSLSITIPAGDSASLPLTITNTGTGVLAFSIKPFASSRLLRAPGGATDPPATANPAGGEITISAAKSKLDAAPVAPPITLSAGGPDNFGYRWLDSGEPGGPVFNWIELGQVGSALNMLDDENQGPFDLGFSFPFYDSSYSSIRICSNGFISFSDRSDTYHNIAIPAGSQPNNLIAPYWSDLAPQLGGQVFYYTNNLDSAIVAWEGVPSYSGNNVYTFEAILSSDGGITYQYKTVIGSANTGTIGIENVSGATGLQVAYNQNYVRDSLALQIPFPIFWLRAVSAGGYALTGQSVQADIKFIANGLSDGQYLGEIRISSNDAATPTIVLPCTLNVGATEISENTAALPIAASLSQNYPNPFNPTTQIKFALPQNEQVNLTVYDLLGREVRRLVDGPLEAGYHSIIWDGRDGSGQQVTSGVYFYAIRAGDFSESRKMVLLK